MRSTEDEEIFDLFGSRLTDTDKVDAYSDESWDMMEQLLDETVRKKTSVVWLYRIVSGAAAILFMFMVFNIFKLNAPKTDKVTKSPVHKILKSSAKKQLDSKENKEIIAAALQNNLRKSAPLHASNSIPKHNSSFLAVNKNDIRSGSQNEIPDSLKSVPIASLVSPSKDKIMNLTSSSEPVNIMADSMKNSAINSKKTGKNTSHNGRRMTFMVLASSDANGVNSFSNERGGTSLAAQFSLKLTRRLSIATGAAYAFKPYQTSFSSYKSNSPGWWGRMFSTKNKPDNVIANCKVLDIPLNVNYEFYNKGRNSFMLGGGLSSYFMLSEKYNFSFADPALSSRNIQINNQNQHIFGVLNLTSTYQRQVNNNLGIVIQPYMKLPLSRIGFGQVDLKSAGVAIGFSWNINSFKGH